ncbi:MAG: serine hydrolase domain-containing protein, partial [Verrucomicrobiota bacterium]
MILSQAKVSLSVLLTVLLAFPPSAMSASSAASVQKVFAKPKLELLDAAIEQAIGESKMPGGVLWLERNGVSYHKAFGSRSLVPEKTRMSEDTIFDAASLTKVIATTPAVLLLIERGRVRLDAAVATYIPEFKGHGKESITVRQLLTHTSGLRPGISATPAWSGYEKAIQLACAEKPLNAPDTVFRYSDINFILLGEVVRRASGQPLHVFVEREIFKPLKMSDTGFLPPE